MSEKDLQDLLFGDSEPVAQTRPQPVVVQPQVRATQIKRTAAQNQQSWDLLLAYLKAKRQNQTTRESQFLEELVKHKKACKLGPTCPRCTSASIYLYHFNIFHKFQLAYHRMTCRGGCKSALCRHMDQCKDPKTCQTGCRLVLQHMQHIKECPGCAYCKLLKPPNVTIAQLSAQRQQRRPELIQQEVTPFQVQFQRVFQTRVAKSDLSFRPGCAERVAAAVERLMEDLIRRMAGAVRHRLHATAKPLPLPPSVRGPLRELSPLPIEACPVFGREALAELKQARKDSCFGALTELKQSYLSVLATREAEAKAVVPVQTGRRKRKREDSMDGDTVFDPNETKPAAQPDLFSASVAAVKRDVTLKRQGAMGALSGGDVSRQTGLFDLNRESSLHSSTVVTITDALKVLCAHPFVSKQRCVHRARLRTVPLPYPVKEQRKPLTIRVPISALQEKKEEEEEEEKPEEKPAVNIQVAFAPYRPEQEQVVAAPQQPSEPLSIKLAARPARKSARRKK